MRISANRRSRVCDLARTISLVGLLAFGAAACDADVSSDEVDRAAEPASSAAGAPEGAGSSDPSGPRVVFLGTSLTAGLGLRSPDERFSERLAELADSAGRPFRLVNAGVSGETSAGGLRRIDWALEGEVDVLVIELGANDGLRGQSPDALEQNLVAIVRAAREQHPGVRIVLLGMEAPPNLGPEYTRSFRAVFPRVAESENVALLPFLLEGVAGESDLNQADGIHPTADGHGRIARTVWPVLDSVLRSGGRP